MRTYNIVDTNICIGNLYKDKTGDHIVIDMAVDCFGDIGNISLLKLRTSSGIVEVKQPQEVLEMEYMGRVNMQPFYDEVDRAQFMYYSKKRNSTEVVELYKKYKTYLNNEEIEVERVLSDQITEKEFLRQRWMELDKIMREYLGMEV
jgi:hypothetical protein|nr:MAG TPA: hypothetical protein [Caudoviricetes sp.]